MWFEREYWVGRAVALLLLSGLCGFAWSSESALVTAASGALTVQPAGQAARPLQAFVKLAPNDLVSLEAGASLQLVYFDSGRQETWRGRGKLTVGEEASNAGKPAPQGESTTLPPVLVRQIARMPNAGDGVRSGMLRLRSAPSLTLSGAEQRYAQLRASASSGDRTPELYLLSAYLELGEYARLDALFDKLLAATPNDAQWQALRELYRQAVADARQTGR